MSGKAELETLPVPLLSEQFIGEFTDHVARSQPGDHVGIASMQLAMQVEREASLVYPLLETLISAKERGVQAEVLVDGRYVRRMTRIGNRDYPNYLPLASELEWSERQATRQRTDTLLNDLRDVGLLSERTPVRLERGYTPALRHFGSFHVAQSQLAVIHSKAAFVRTTVGETTAWLNTGNLTDSDLRLPTTPDAIGMNNVIMRLNGNAAMFVIKAVTEGFDREAGTHFYGARVKLVHDVGNNGEPARLPAILNEALIAIDPRRDSHIRDPHEHRPPELQSAVLLSQYAPNGLLANALTHAASRGAYINVPLEPGHDHRSAKFPYNLNNGLFALRSIGKTIERRRVPSHIKALVTAYDDGTAKFIFGTDNFVTNIQKLVRNEEIAAVISLDTKKPEDAQYFTDVVTLLRDIGEISDDTLKRLLQTTL